MNYSEIYRKTSEYAKKNGEIDNYRESWQLNMDCHKAIEEAIAKNYKRSRLDSKTAYEEVCRKYGSERTALVCAYSLDNFRYDGRISRENKEWACSFLEAADVCIESLKYCVIDQVHVGLLDLFTDWIRRIA